MSAIGKNSLIDSAPLEDLETEWTQNNMPAKREGGHLREIIVSRRPAVNPSYDGGESRIVKLLTLENNQHIGTIHEIVMPDGSVPHSHPKDYTRRNCSRVRVADP